MLSWSYWRRSRYRPRRWPRRRRRGDDRAGAGHAGDGHVIGGAGTGDGGRRGAAAVPARVTSPVAKSVTASLKMTVKWIGLVLVGSAWPPPG